MWIAIIFVLLMLIYVVILNSSNIMEEHYIFFRHSTYQTLFDARNTDHSILIRALFHWENDSPTRAQKLDLMLDNLRESEKGFILIGCYWCDRRERIELHLQISDKVERRSVFSISFSEPIDFKQKIELTLRKSYAGNKLPICEEYDLARTDNDNEIHNLEEWAQDDKDGSILIGTDMPRL
ncbi:MAG TPA: hypothetical protein VFF21_10605 [Flavobacteriaceae bacterium]|nr:hypothetical protein [Flavobacteriaceae bacterium]